MNEQEHKVIELALRWFEVVWCQCRPSGAPRAWDDVRLELQRKRGEAENDLYDAAKALWEQRKGTELR